MKDNMLVKTNIKIENMIYEIRGKQVMLDSDLAKLYGVETKRINEAVRRNIEKFPERFCWIVENEEILNLTSQNATSSLNNNYGGRRYKTRVFTEQGVAMLATILKSSIATEVSIRIMDAFVAMRHYIGSNLLEQKYINNIVLEDHDLIKKNSNDIKLLQETFEKFEEKEKINHIFFNGQIYDAYAKIYDIFKSSKKELIIIDNYADKTILDIIKRININVIIITKENNLLSKQDIEKYNKQYNNLKVIYDNTFHDRFFIIDREKVYHCGSSINRIGYKTFSINIMSDKDVYIPLIKRIEGLIN